jgi:hypothetical protein
MAVPEPHAKVYQLPDVPMEFGLTEQIILVHATQYVRKYLPAAKRGDIIAIEGYTHIYSGEVVEPLQLLPKGPFVIPSTYIVDEENFSPTYWHGSLFGLDSFDRFWWPSKEIREEAVSNIDFGDIDGAGAYFTSFTLNGKAWMLVLDDDQKGVKPQHFIDRLQDETVPFEWLPTNSPWQRLKTMAQSLPNYCRIFLQELPETAEARLLADAKWDHTLYYVQQVVDRSILSEFPEVQKMQLAELGRQGAAWIDPTPLPGAPEGILTIVTIHGHFEEPLMDLRFQVERFHGFMPGYDCRGATPIEGVPRLNEKELKDYCTFWRSDLKPLEGWSSQAVVRADQIRSIISDHFDISRHHVAAWVENEKLVVAVFRDRISSEKFEHLTYGLSDLVCY